MKKSKIPHFVAVLICIALLASGVGALAQEIQAEPRVALVIGNANYSKASALNALNDAGLVAEALRSIGFDVVEGANLTQPDMMGAFRTFLGKVEAAGPQTIAFAYVSGLGLTFEGENFLASVDARFERESDIPLGAVRLADFTRPLAGTPARARVLVLDASRPLPFTIEGKPVRGLQPLDAPAGMLVAFANGPGTFAQDGPGPYGAYATAVAEMIRAPGINLEAVFMRIRARAHQLTEGQQIPWHVSALGSGVVLVPGDSAPASAALMSDRPLQDIGPEDGYAVAIAVDSLDRYVEFVKAFPDHPYAPRVWSIIRARRDALTWLRAIERNSAEAYWTYLARYPQGIYAEDARRRLRRIAAALSPPPDFAPIGFADIGPPLAGEPAAFAPNHGPPPPTAMIGPPSPTFVNMPPPREGPGVFPGVSRSLPILVRPRPPQNVPQAALPSPAAVPPKPSAQRPPVARLPAAKPPAGAPVAVRTPSGGSHLRPQNAPRRTGGIEPGKPPTAPKIAPAARAVQAGPPRPARKPAPSKPVCKLVNGAKVCR